MTDTSGLSSSAPFAFCDPDTSSVRTSQPTLDLGLTESSVTLPKWGWMSGGALYERPTQVPPTSVPVSSSLLPTPVAQDDRKSPEASLAHKRRMGRTQLTSLSVLAKAGFKQPMLPTPTSRDGKGRNQRDDRSCLPGAVKLLPTPVAQDAAAARRATLPNVANHTAKPGVTLLDAIRLLPTPTTDDANNLTRQSGAYSSLTREVSLLPTPIARDASQRHRQGGRTLRTAVGELTSTPSDDGNSS